MASGIGTGRNSSTTTKLLKSHGFGRSALLCAHGLGLSSDDTAEPSGIGKDPSFRLVVGKGSHMDTRRRKAGMWEQR